MTVDDVHRNPVKRELYRSLGPEDRHDMFKTHQTESSIQGSLYNNIEKNGNHNED